MGRKQPYGYLLRETKEITFERTKQMLGSVLRRVNS